MAEGTKNLVERLFNEQREALQRFLFRRVRKRPDAAELAQEAYARLLGLSRSKGADLDRIRNPEAYLFAVASNLAKEHAQRTSKASTCLNIDDPAVQQQLAEIPGIADDLDTEQRVRRLKEVLQQLPPKCRATVELQYWHGLSYQEIAQQLGISTSMVKKYLSQALLHCRRRMAGIG